MAILSTLDSTSLDETISFKMVHFSIKKQKQKQTRAVLGFRGLRVARLMACGCWV